MIIELILRAFLLAFLCAIFILTLEAGQWIMAQLEIAWLNAAIVYSTLLIGANILLANIRLTFTGRRDAKASEILLSSIFVFAFVALVMSRPASLGLSNWTWTYPYFEIAVAIQASSIGHIISALWPLTTAVCVFRGSWAVISRDLGHAFHGIVGSHFTIVGRLVDKVHRVSLERFGQGVS